MEKNKIMHEMGGVDKEKFFFLSNNIRTGGSPLKLRVRMDKNIYISLACGTPCRRMW